jgi:hypothetical protein
MKSAWYFFCKSSEETQKKMRNLFQFENFTDAHTVWLKLFSYNCDQYNQPSKWILCLFPTKICLVYTCT